MSGREPKTASNDLLAGYAILLAQAVRFYSRLPVPRLPFEADPHALPDFAQLPRLLPLAALLIALPSAATLLVGHLAGLPPLLAAGFAIAVLVLSTGAFHEDGLADTADGLFGGTGPERRLEIMKDSRVGSYGAAALCFSLLLRVIALAEIVERAGIDTAIGIVLAAAALSRTAGLAPLVLLAPARPDGASAAVGQPSRETFLVAALAALAVAAICLGVTGGPMAALIWMLAASTLVAWGMSRLAARLIGGQTGDIAGAVQQLAEICCLTIAVALCASTS